MEPWEVRELLQLVFGYGLGFALVISVGRTLRLLVERRTSSVGGAQPKELRDIAERLTRIEQAVDSMAIEVERVAEAHRYTARLLTDRQNASVESPRSLGRVVTPH